MVAVLLFQAFSTMSSNPPIDCLKLKNLSYHELNAELSAWGLAGTLFRTLSLTEVGPGKSYQNLKTSNGSTVKLHIYSLKDAFTSDQFKFFITFLNSIQEKKYFKYQVKCITRGTKAFMMYHLATAAGHLQDSRSIRDVKQLDNSLLQINAIHEWVDLNRGVFLGQKMNFLLTAEEEVLLDCDDFFSLYEAHSVCYKTG